MRDLPMLRQAFADRLKDMSRVMAALRERYSGAIDLSQAAAVARRLLG
jgi:uncharacterized protein YqeY